MYINDTTKIQKTHTEVKEEYPNSSLPPDGVEVIGGLWFLIHKVSTPAYDVYTEAVALVEPTKQSGVYYDVWQISPLDQVAIDSNIETAKEYKYSEIALYSDSLIDDANTNPYVGKVTSATSNKHRVSTRINKSTNGTPKVPIDADRDDALADYTDSVMDADDLARDVVEALSDAQAIYDTDITTIIGWPQWFAPA